jgi:hypothetical protein
MCSYFMHEGLMKVLCDEIFGKCYFRNKIHTLSCGQAFKLSGNNQLYNEYCVISLEEEHI